VVTQKHKIGAYPYFVFRCLFTVSVFYSQENNTSELNSIFAKVDDRRRVSVILCVYFFKLCIMHELKAPVFFCYSVYAMKLSVSNKNFEHFFCFHVIEYCSGQYHKCIYLHKKCIASLR
jgi:hypothetical protein